MSGNTNDVESQARAVARATLEADIRSLASRATNGLTFQLGRQEVNSLLEAAAATGVTNGDVQRGRVIYQKAAESYHYYLQTQNRVRYFVGVLFGLDFSYAFGVILTSLGAQSAIFGVSTLAIMLFLFAPLGSIASVLTRLSSIDLGQETSLFISVISGASKPIIATIFAIVVYLILSIGIVKIDIGGVSTAVIDINTPDLQKDRLFYIISFLCGFSERAAADVIARVPFGKLDEPTRGVG